MRAYAFRDHLGYGLLFYRYDGDGFYAATEAKQVVAGAGIRREPDLDVVEGIFFNSFDDETPCALRGVQRLPKAHGITRRSCRRPAPAILGSRGAARERADLRTGSLKSGSPS